LTADQNSEILVSEWSDEIAAFLDGKRLFPDVSVLLASALYPDSPSHKVLTLSATSRILVSPHTETTALAVLRAAAPTLVSEFCDYLLATARTGRLERVASGDHQQLGSLPSSFSSEDRQVLADAAASAASILYTHDSKFFSFKTPGPIIISPASHAWEPLDRTWIRPGQAAWSFLGWFVPQWSTAAVRGTRELFYVFEFAGHSHCFYDAARESFCLQWSTPSPGRLRLPFNVEAQGFHFVSVVARQSSVMLFANGHTRSSPITLDPLPARTTFHPFMSAASLHQISGGCQFTVTEATPTEAALRRHWQARSICLTDGELRFLDALARNPYLGRVPWSAV
jgi:hypothetical protein